MSKQKDKLSAPITEENQAPAPFLPGRVAMLSLALAAFVAGPAAQANPPADSKLGDRLAAAKDKLAKSQASDQGSIQLAQWLNVGIPAPWGNWNNWHNWHNWGNTHWGWYNY
jgi:hypothetical protein